jgi:hypothetical protein
MSRNLMEETPMFDTRRSIARKAVVLLSSVAMVSGGVFIGASPASATVATVAVTKLSVNKGATTATTPVKITGRGFTTWTPVAADVVFNGTAVSAAPIVLSDTEMAVVAPVQGSGTLTGNVIVSDTVGSSFTATAAATANAWTYIAPLLITPVTAGTLLSSLGTTVLPVAVTSGLGSTLVAFTAAKITATVGSATAKVKWLTDTTATITVPAGTPSATAVKICLLSNGVSDQAVTGGSCSTIAKFATVISKLSVTSSVPTGNSSATAITITGKGFTGNTAVTFGAVAATCTSATATADTKLVCTIPASAASPVGGVVQVIITPAAGLSYGTTAASAFAYTDV